MTAGMVGADADALDAGASRLDVVAEAYDTLNMAINTRLRTLMWVGNVASNLIGELTGVHLPHLRATSDMLRETATLLRRNAAEQRRASLEASGLIHSTPIAHPTSLEYSLTANKTAVQTEAARLEAKGNALTASEQTRLELYKRILGDPNLHVLSFDPNGDGKIAVVEGDILHAERIAIVVPGISNTLDKLSGGPLADGHNLYLAVGAGAAVVTWLGYDTPPGPLDGGPSKYAENFAEIASPNDADIGKRALIGFVNDVAHANPTASVTVIGHSYGTLVIGEAAREGLPVDNVVLLGSPGVKASSVADFHLNSDAQVYASSHGGGIPGVENDYVTGISRVGDLFGPHPTDPSFGARVFNSGRAAPLTSHGGYFTPGDKSLQNIASIVNGNGAPDEMPQ